MTKLTQALQKQLIDFPNRPLIKEASEADWHTGAQFAADVAHLEQAYTDAKIGAHDLLLVCLSNSTAYPELMQSMWDRGIAVHPIAGNTPVAELLNEWHEQDYTAMVVDNHLRDALMTAENLTAEALNIDTNPNLSLLVDTKRVENRIQSPAAPILEDDLALILNTSGTTGKPKRVGLSHRLIYNAGRHNAASQSITDQDTTMIVMPMFHINAQVMAVVTTRLSGGKIVVTPKFSASHFWQQCAENDVTWVAVVPTIVTILLINQNANAQYEQYQDQLKLRFVRSSSFSLPEDKFTAFEKRFHTQILEGYGMTETASQVTINPIDAPVIGSAGKVYGTDLAIYTDGQFTTAPNVSGEIAVKGDHVISHYMDGEHDSFKDGWFLTGDLGYVDEKGYLFVQGRSKDMISRGGEKVAPAYVENALNKLSFIKELAVIGLPDPIHDEAVTAVIVPKVWDPSQEQAWQDALFAFAQQKLAKYEQPTLVYFIKEFPVNNTGKVLRAELKQQILQQQVSSC
ncbi:acyl-CoA synthetase family protein [Lactobacillus selangorensis]|uniref:Acyl-CoA synthetase family protein n=1 Tax=Lactobacillus selangorensis TaxID=81857 RepID=A0A0R2FLR3_9LACO|nr:AMP-binding protein [Lactobacillus selangorensis]KRN28651.1 acyl-CoA synthetase family protein [Lactobacillus selangorensis]KRN32939.1 acyl-CoA synthetase family protein [Lactobacillus selangorensis]